MYFDHAGEKNPRSTTKYYLDVVFDISPLSAWRVLTVASDQKQMELILSENNVTNITQYYFNVGFVLNKLISIG